MRLRLIAAIVLLCGWSASAQPLVDRLPDTTLLYVGWSPDAPLWETAPAKMLSDERPRRPLLLILRQVLEELPGDVVYPSDEAAALIGDLARCEVAAALLDVTPLEDELDVRAVAVVNLGAQRADFQKHFKPLQDRLKEAYGQKLQMMKMGDGFLWVKPDDKDRPRLVWGFIGDQFVVYRGADAEQMLRAALGLEAPARPLRDDPTFRAASARLPGAAVLTSYVNGQRLLATAQTALVAPEPAPWHEIAPYWPALLREIGVEHLSAIVEKTTVEDGLLVTRTHVLTAQAPTGLLAELMQPAVDPQLLKAVPPDAMAAIAFRADLARLYDRVKASADTVWGREAAEAFAQMEQAAAAFGLPPKDVLAPIGDQWVLYNAASNGGLPLVGFTLVGTVRDPERFARSEEAIRRVLAEQFGGDRQSMRQYEAQGTTIHYLQQRRWFAPFAPAWAVRGDRFVVALYPQLVEDALGQLEADRSLLDDPAFTKAWDRVGRNGPLAYISQEQAVRSVYPLLLVFATAVGEWDDDVNSGAIPSMQRVLQYVGPDMLGVQKTDDGYVRTLVQVNPLLSPLTVLSPNLWLGLTVPLLLDK